MMAEYEQKEHGNGAIAFIPLALVVIPLFFGVNVLYTLLDVYKRQDHWAEAAGRFPES